MCSRVMQDVDSRSRWCLHEQSEEIQAENAQFCPRPSEHGAISVHRLIYSNAFSIIGCPCGLKHLGRDRRDRWS